MELESIEVLNKIRFEVFVKSKKFLGFIILSSDTISKLIDELYVSISDDISETRKNGNHLDQSNVVFDNLRNFEMTLSGSFEIYGFLFISISKITKLINSLEQSILNKF